MKKLLIFFTIVSVFTPLFFVGAVTNSNIATVATEITGFTPTEGKVGDEVTIIGKNFTGVTSVLFNNVSGTTKESSANKIIVKVPVAATTGKITVKTNLYGEFTTADNFTVTGTTAVGTGNGTGGTGGNSSVTNPNTVIKFSGLVPVCNTGKIDAKTGNYEMLVILT